AEPVRGQHLRVQLTGEGDRRRRHEETEHECAGVPHEELGRTPVQRQEADAGPDEDCGEEGGEVEVGRLTGVAGDDVGVGEEDAVRDQAHAGDEPVEAVDEVHRVHHDDNGHHGDRDAHPVRADEQLADGQGQDLQAAHDRDDTGGEELRAELDHPVQVPEIVDHPDDGDEQRRPQHR
ncbi:hypothetical protein ABE10_00460, partial [Bacillus toyonensis]|nr:hypothetical protein [Bacillus toyonensis]